MHFTVENLQPRCKNNLNFELPFNCLDFKFSYVTEKKDDNSRKLIVSYFHNDKSSFFEGVAYYRIYGVRSCICRHRSQSLYGLGDKGLPQTKYG